MSRGRPEAFPPDAPCDALFLHAAATATPAEQFAQEQHRHHYQLWQIGNGLYAAGMAVFGSGLLYAGVQLFDVYNLRQQIQSDQTQFDAISAEYARVTATFPPTPTSTENLKTTIKQYRTLQTQTASPAYLFAEISKALAGFPQVEIERIEWRVGKPPQESGAKAAASKAAAPAPAAAGAPAAAPAADLGYELATVSARVVGARRADVRSITDMASQFIAALKKIPQLEIIGRTHALRRHRGRYARGRHRIGARDSGRRALQPSPSAGSSADEARRKRPEAAAPAHGGLRRPGPRRGGLLFRRR